MISGRIFPVEKEIRSDLKTITGDGRNKAFTKFR
jgi:hypothetical protein